MGNIYLRFLKNNNSKKAAVVPVDMNWSDPGSWDSIYQHCNKDNAGNVIQGDVLYIKTA
jgi:mannose-1-phosphate guanylyltransferase/mannose-6-phosphate isomerase